MESLNDLSVQLYEVLRQRIPDPVEAEQLLCANLQLASLQIGTAPVWPNDKGFANHAKFIHVDDQVFSVGSNNMYPASLQEYDLIVDDETAAQQVREAYLDPLWEWSSQDAIIDPDQDRCDIFG
jgi:phosphatidylserine/phosphatidylglycerophosphate/cardiolipin synthase-like enzyme